MGLFRKLTSRGAKATAPAPAVAGAPPPPPPPPGRALSAQQENALAALAKHDTVFLVDDSGSMQAVWDEQLAPALTGVVDTATRYDSDGVDICFFNSRERCTSRSSAEILPVFRRVRPRYTTPTKDAVARVLDPYMREFEQWHSGGKAKGVQRPKPLNLIILTDGAPDQGQNPEDVIVKTAQKLDELRAPPFQVGLSFVQIGAYAEATEHLQSLDDDLREKHKIRDIVDTTLFEGQLTPEYLLKSLLGGINRSIDRQN
ncbi:hypothetical protein JCM10213_004020 [Rhodosporidiobolus nylandii]